MEIKSYLKDEMERQSNDISVTPDIHSLIERNKAKKRSHVLMVIPIISLIVIIGLISSLVLTQGSPSRSDSSVVTTTTLSSTTLPNGRSTTSVTTKSHSGTPGTTSGVTTTTSSPVSTTQPFTTTTLDPNPTWNSQVVANIFGSGYLVGFNGISCPSIENCYAIGYSQINTNSPRNFFLISTTNEGASWNKLNLPSTGIDLESISCASIDRCLAVGMYPSVNEGLIMITTDGGSTWSNSTMLGNGNSAPYSFQVSCPINTRLCVVSGYPPSSNGSVPVPLEVEVSSDGGSTFSLANSISTPYNGDGWPMELACSNAGTCLIIAHEDMPNSPGVTFLMASSDGGEDWKPISTPKAIGETNYYINVNCYTGTNCLVLGDTSANTNEGIIWTTTDGGVSWAIVTVTFASFDQQELNGSNFSCTASFCRYASSLSGTIYSFNLDTSSLSVAYSIPGNQIYGLSCSTDANCLGFYGASSGPQNVSISPNKQYGQLKLS